MCKFERRFLAARARILYKLVAFQSAEEEKRMMEKGEWNNH